MQKNGLGTRLTIHYYTGSSDLTVFQPCLLVCLLVCLFVCLFFFVVFFVVFFFFVVVVDDDSIADYLG